MTLDEFSEKYRDLVFAPLGIPEVPVDSELLAEWCSGTSTMRQEFTNIYDDEAIHQFMQERLNTKNVFGISSLYRLCDTLHDGMFMIRPDFQECFPEFQDWFENLPFIKHSKFIPLVLLRQTPIFRKKFKCPDFAPIHYDQKGYFSLRIWVNNRKNRMFMIPRKVPVLLSDSSRGEKATSDIFHAKDEQGDLIINPEGYPVPSDDHYNIHLPVSSPYNNDIFIMNEAKAAHSYFPEEYDPEDYTPELEKFTFLLGDTDSDPYDWQIIDNLIQEAIKKHPEHVVWFSDKDGQYESV